MSKEKSKPKAARRVEATEFAAVPHSWPLKEWDLRASHVYPHTTSRAEYLVRANKTDLLAASAVVRIGRDLVLIGARYTKWLEKHAADVPGFVAGPQRATSLDA